MRDRMATSTYTVRSDFLLTRDDLIVWHGTIKHDDGRYYNAVRVLGAVYNRPDRKSPWRTTDVAAELGHAPAIFSAERWIADNRDDFREPLADVEVWARRMLAAAGYQPSTSLWMTPITAVVA